MIRRRAIALASSAGITIVVDRSAILRLDREAICDTDTYCSENT